MTHRETVEALTTYLLSEENTPRDALRALRETHSKMLIRGARTVEDAPLDTEQALYAHENWRDVATEVRDVLFRKIRSSSPVLKNRRVAAEAHGLRRRLRKWVDDLEGTGRLEDARCVARHLESVESLIETASTAEQLEWFERADALVDKVRSDIDDPRGYVLIAVKYLREMIAGMKFHEAYTECHEVRWKLEKLAEGGDVDGVNQMLDDLEGRLKEAGHDTPPTNK